MRNMIAVLALLSLAAAACGSEPAELSGFVRDPLPSVRDVALPDVSAGGTPFEMLAQDGGLLIVYFGYTECPDVCPTTLADMRKVYRELGDDGDKVSFAMETIDIERDTSEILPAYVQSFIPEAHALRAPDDVTLRAAADVFGADYSVEITQEGKYEVAHTAHLYAIDDAGLLQVTWAFGTEPEVIVKDIRLLLNEQ